MTPDVSFIVPVYNTERYLRQCVDSILKLEILEFEIILINDGSTDGSKYVCEEYSAKYPRVTLISKENQGLGYARNTGIEVAKGRYVSFIDSDDWVAPNMGIEISRIINAGEIEFLEFGLQQTDPENSRVGMKLPVIRPGSYTREDILDNIIPNFLADKGERIANSVCNHLYLNRIIKEHNLRFFSEREVYTEDFLFNLQYITKVSSLLVVDSVFYFYRFNFGSLTKSFRIDYLQLIERRDRKAIEILNQTGGLEKYKQHVNVKFSRITPLFILNLLNKKGVSREEQINEIGKLLASPYFVSGVANLRLAGQPVKFWPLYIPIIIGSPTLVYHIYKTFKCFIYK